MKKIVFLVNGSEKSAMGIRASSLAARIGDRFDIGIAHRGLDKLASIGQFLEFLKRIKPDLICVFDMSYSGVAAALGYKLTTPVKVVIDTGDAITELARSSGRSTTGLALTWVLEKTSLRFADRIIVRGTFHQEFLAAQGVQSEFLPDGVDLRQFQPTPSEELRRSLGFDGSHVIGVLGNSVWNEKLGWCYGWELVEVIARLRHMPLKGLVIGSGTGIAKLTQRCREYGIEDRIHFAGNIDYDQLNGWLSAMDICLSTQTNDLPGQVRTTGKLPLYLACGRFVLASRTGQAARILPPEMLVDYTGTTDPAYPAKLADRIESLPVSALGTRWDSVELAQQNFDYDLLASRLAGLFTRLLA